MSDHLYVFGLGGNGSPLKMFDLPAFRYIRIIESILLQLESEIKVQQVPEEKLLSMGAAQLSPYEYKILGLVLNERGFMISKN